MINPTPRYLIIYQQYNPLPPIICPSWLILLHKYAKPFYHLQIMTKNIITESHASIDIQRKDFKKNLSHDIQDTRDNIKENRVPTKSQPDSQGNSKLDSQQDK